MSVPLIQTPDGFELVRNAIANILVGESISQQAKADAWNLANPGETQLDPEEWALDVYVERANPWELYRDPNNENVQLVNIWYSRSNVDTGRSSQSTQATTSIVNVDCMACAITEETDTGQEPGDEAATLRAQKVTRLCRRILMHPDYRILGLPTIVGTRNMTSRSTFPGGGPDIPSRHIDGIRLQFDISHKEEYDYDELSASEGALITIKRDPSGPILVQLDYDWT